MMPTECNDFLPSIAVDYIRILMTHRLGINFPFRWFRFSLWT